MATEDYNKTSCNHGTMSRKDAGYRESDNPNERCRVCRYRHPCGDAVYCRVVEGTIEPDDVCDYFSHK